MTKDSLGQLRLFEERAIYEAITSPRSFPIVEVFGFPYGNESPEAVRCRSQYRCPFIGARCVKGGHDIDIPLGTCGVHSKYGPIITCPQRFYGDDYRLLDQVATHLVGESTNTVRIPEVGPGVTYSLDWIVATYDEDLQLLDYHGIKVQAIDITGSVRPYFEAYLSGRPWEQIEHRYGINWANVYKRMLPQLLAKEAMLASYGKKLAVIIQDQLLAYVGRTGRMDIEVEEDATLVNLIFFSYRLRFLPDANVYTLELDRIIPTSSRKLEAAFIAGLIGTRMPPKEEFDRIVADKMIEVINSQK
jgi:hypothetical protein